MSVHVHQSPRGFDIHVAEQHVYRLTERECRDVVLHLLMASREIREQVTEWLTRGTIEKVADALHPEQSAVKP